jgi:6-phosphogluconolactonase (cycloisomerase 2 family)
MLLDLTTPGDEQHFNSISQGENMKNKVILSALVITLGLAQTGIADNADYQNSNAKAVFVMTNGAERNEVLSYRRQGDGSLKREGVFRTGGRGSGGTTDPLGSQGSLTLSQDHSVLLAVNAGSGEISSFLVNGPKLRLVDVKPSGGSAPVAVAESGNLIYVLNFAGNSNVVGFHLQDGYLRPIPKSIRYLTSANSGASSLAFSPDGRFLAATEKLNNNIDVFPVEADGTLGPLVVTKDPAAGLFAVTFAPDGALLSVETGGSTISSFLVESAGTLAPLTAGVPTLGAATCWHVVTPDGRFVYTSNSGTSTISAFAIAGAGLLTPLPGTVVASNPAGSTNLDIAISSDGKFLYTLNSGTGAVGMFAINADGTLKSLGTLGGLPISAGFNGIAAL